MFFVHTAHLEKHTRTRIYTYLVLCYFNRHLFNWLTKCSRTNQLHINRTDILCRWIETLIVVAPTVMGSFLCNLQMRFANCRTMRKSRQFAKQIDKSSIHSQRNYLSKLVLDKYISQLISSENEEAHGYKNQQISICLLSTDGERRNTYYQELHLPARWHLYLINIRS